MPYKDPAKERAVKAASERRRRAVKGHGLSDMAEAIAAAEGLPEPPSREVLMKALGVQAIQGNVPAIRLLLEEYRRDGNEDVEQVRSAIDELAGRRASRAG